jgi:hypothetical protein
MRYFRSARQHGVSWEGMGFASLRPIFLRGEGSKKMRQEEPHEGFGTGQSQVAESDEAGWIRPVAIILILATLYYLL